MTARMPCRITDEVITYDPANAPDIDEAEVLAEANRQIQDPDWWNSTLEGICPVTNAVPEALARCMQNLDAACTGDAIALNAITSALHVLQKQARAMAYETEEARLT